MRSPLFPVMPAVLLAVICGCGKEDVKPGEHYAMVLVVDGLRTDECTLSTKSAITGTSGVAFARHLWKDIAAEGVVVPTLQNHGITITAPAHAQLLTGRLDNFANVAVDNSRGPAYYRSPFPTLFELLRQQTGVGAEDGVLIANTELVSPLTSGLYPGLGLDLAGKNVFVTKSGSDEIPAPEDQSVFDAIYAELDAGPPRLMVVNVHQTDRAGHYQDGPAYADAITEVDGLIGDLWTRLRRDHPKYVEQLLFVVTADHGRHRHTGDSGFKNHGDGCSGCRDVPLFLAGGAVSRRGVVDETWTQLDLSATIAAWLGLAQPLGQGRTMSSLVAVPAWQPTGEVDVAQAGSLLATRRLRQDSETRSEIVVDGEVVSSGLHFAEAPAVATGQSRWLCWRELSLDDPDWRLWTPMCLRDAGAGWDAIGFPLEEVGMGFSPQMRELTDGSLEVVFVDNTRTVATTGSDEGNGPRITRYSPGAGWSTPTGPPLFLGTDPSVVEAEGELLVAVAHGLTETSRYDRQVSVYVVGTEVWPSRASLPFTEVLGEVRRVERPALSYADGVLRLAALAIDDAGPQILLTESTDNGRSWTAARALPGVSSPYFYLPLRWDGRHLVWIQGGDDDSPVGCRLAPDEAAPACLGLGSHRIDSYSVADGVLTASLDGGSGAWSINTSRW